MKNTLRNCAGEFISNQIVPVTLSGVLSDLIDSV
jgi:hypothetical protein